jgi:cysteinyl-tRNA synthetase
MDDDCNTAAALAVLFELAKVINREANLMRHQQAATLPVQTIVLQWQTLSVLARVLGLEATETQPDLPANDLSDAAIDAQVSARTEAKKAKDFATADRIRQELKTLGITLVDQPRGVTIWHQES